MSSMPARSSLRRGSARHPPAQRVSQHLLDETVMAPSEENGHGVGSPDMIKLAQSTLLRTSGVLRTGGHTINASRAPASAAPAERALSGGHVIEAQPRFPGSATHASAHGSAATHSTSDLEAHTAAATASGGVFGAGEAIFDASRALAVLQSLAQTSDAEMSAGAMMDRLNEKVEELRTLRTSAAEHSLAEHKAAVAARDAAADDGAAALRAELEETRRRLRDAEKALHKLRTSPPPPSDAAVERHPLFVAEADARERAERRLETTERRLTSAEQAKKALLAAATSSGSRRRGRGAGAGAGSEASAAAVAAVSAELQAAEARASDAESFLSVLLGMEVERTDDDGKWWSVILPVEDESVELEVELVAGADSQDDDEDEDEDEEAIREVCVRPVSGQHLLPPSMQDTFSFGSEDGPRFLVQLLTHFVGEVVTEPVEEEDDEASAAAAGSQPSSSSSSGQRA